MRRAAKGVALLALRVHALGNSAAAPPPLHIVKVSFPPLRLLSFQDRCLHPQNVFFSFALFLFHFSEHLLFIHPFLLFSPRPPFQSVWVPRCFCRKLELWKISPFYFTYSYNMDAPPFDSFAILFPTIFFPFIPRISMRWKTARAARMEQQSELFRFRVESSLETSSFCKTCWLWLFHFLFVWTFIVLFSSPLIFSLDFSSIFT